MIVEKEREIQAFTPEESWKMQSLLTYEKNSFPAVFTKIDGKNKKLTSQEDAQKIFATLGVDIASLKESKTKKDTLEFTSSGNIDFTLNEVIQKESKRTPGAPFTTSTLQQEAARKFGFGVKQTMTVAQKLYEGMDLGNGERQ